MFIQSFVLKFNKPALLRHLCSQRSGNVKLPKQLKLYQGLLENNENALSNVHLNPATHFLALKSEPSQEQTVPLQNQKSLVVSVLGVPNAGKSTLINSLCGFVSCATSSKTHTTRKNAMSILTNKNTQIIFQDTPGVVTAKDAARFKLDDYLVTGPEKSCFNADLILVVQDVSNRFTREAINKQILRLLSLFPHIPSVLLLHKMDTFPRSRRGYDLIRKLTLNHLEGSEVKVQINKWSEKMTSEDYFKAKEKKDSKVEEQKQTPAEMLEFLKQRGKNITEEEVARTISGVVGWPGFSDVFPTSAFEPDGINNLKEFLLEKAIQRPWKFSPKLKTKEDPRDIVLSILKAKFLERVPGDVAYKLEPIIETWNVETGFLRVAVSIDSLNNRTTNSLFHGKGEILKGVAMSAQEELSDFFECQVFIAISVNVKHERKIHRKLSTKEGITVTDIYL